MPTYEFECPNGHRFDKFFRKMSNAATELPCPECGLPAMRRVSGGAGLLFKGSGFYITDYGKDGKKPRTDAKESAPSKESGAAASSESGGKSGSTGGGESGGTPVKSSESAPAKKSDKSGA